MLSLIVNWLLIGSIPVDVCGCLGDVDTHPWNLSNEIYRLIIGTIYNVTGILEVCTIKHGIMDTKMVKPTKTGNQFVRSSF